MTNYNFFSNPSLPRPSVTQHDATSVARDLFHVTGHLTELGSQQDRNFLIDDGETRWLLKFSNPAFSAQELEAQDAAAERVSLAGIDVPRSVPSRDGAAIRIVHVDDVDLHVRLLSFVEGDALTSRGALSVVEARSLGHTAGRLAASLEDFVHPGTERVTQWNLRIATQVVQMYLPHVPDLVRRERVREAAAQAQAALQPLSDKLRSQPIHGDITDDNVVTRHGSTLGVIDFGDIADSWIVAELAVTCASILHHNPRTPLIILETIAAFVTHTPLTDDELAALWALIVLRTCVLVVSGEQQVAVDDANHYASENRDHEWIAFEAAEGLDAQQMCALIRARVRFDRRSVIERPEALLLQAAPMSVLDFSVTNPELSDGIWVRHDSEAALAAAVFRTSGTAVTRYGEYRLTRAKLHYTGETATLALGVEVVSAPGTVFSAPVDGAVRIEGDALVLEASGYEIWLSGLEPVATGRVSAGQRIGAARAGTARPEAPVHVRVQLSRVAGIRPAFFATPAEAEIWQRVYPDPSPLLGIDLAAPELLSGDVLERRVSTFAAVQEHYYTEPPEIERGWREHLIDVHAQCYLDLVNNVALAGHAHPRLVKAVSNQWSLLNTNSRFNYSALPRFTERLVALAPDGLDTVFLVNSGSEAVDLALRLAKTYTGNDGVLAFQEAYHGWTVGADAVSSSIGDNPRALETRPDWVHVIDAPHPFRGTYRGADSAARYLEDLEARLGVLDDAGTGLAAFIGEPVFGNAGGVLLPDGYLAGVFEKVRSRGGLTISDEVQVGYGRLGEYFWGVEQQGVIPDIITIAKGMGNGQPVGAVITRRDIAEKFAEEGSMFSSAGGSPVSCVVGLTVLDILHEEGLQENARTVGGDLKAKLVTLQGRHDIIGAVHGLGLYLGVELVRDLDTLEPASVEASEICEELLREGCIVQPTGDYKNVLKIKPPLNITTESVDFFVEALDRVLSARSRR
ncbi:aminotransferase [Cryobacterium sp. 10C2]|uniref:aminotransferase n=2 Tax=unclassified Cryobacterium TaxID=2649013 RepID=UPI002AB5A946|nr:aminotransferase [Cryobacterium sp. 10C2]MDY7526581.1 aminotransferase [Cryobacterium sp. 10C2]MEB0290547.1 aminotransferase [Cryobacterium sp. 10C2]